MKPIKLLIIPFLLLSGVVFSQAVEGQDPNAKAILDNLSKKTKSYTSITAEFNMLMESKDKKTSETQKGKLILKGNKYRLDIKGQVLISDGKKTWTILKDAKEVQINGVDSNSKESVSPSTIFTVYEKGYKYKFDSEKGNIQTIILYPNDPGSKKFHTIKLDVHKTKKQITGFKVMMKDGSVFTYTITLFTPNTEVKPTDITFDQKQFPGYEIIRLDE